MKKQKKYEIISETDKVVTFKYDGAECSYAKACYSSIDEVIKEIDEERVREKEVDKRIASQRDTMTPEELSVRMKPTAWSLSVGRMKLTPISI